MVCESESAVLSQFPALILGNRAYNQSSLI